jgi:enoyl-CoA hydratase
LVCSCDIIFASERATFGLTEINVGRLGGASRAMRLVGPYKARMMLFSGELLTAQEVYRFGGIEEVVVDGSVEERAIWFANRLATKSPIGLRLAKESIVRIESYPLEEAYRIEQDYTVRLSTFTDSGEALAAFMERREPRWDLA